MREREESCSSNESDTPVTTHTKSSTLTLLRIVPGRRAASRSCDDRYELLRYAESASYQRRFGSLKCEDIMPRGPIAVSYGTSLAEAWRLMQDKRVKALPVVDRGRFIVGIVTMADFMDKADLDHHASIGEKLQDFVRPSDGVHSDRPEVVGQIMTRQVRMTSADHRAIDLASLLSEAGHHHIPVIDAERKLVGVITQSDLARSQRRA